MATNKQWIDAMRGVPFDRRAIYRDIREQVRVVFSSGIRQSEDELDQLWAKFEPGETTVAGIQYRWRCARFPCYVEWQMFGSSGILEDTTFQTISEWSEKPVQANQQLIASRLANKRFLSERKFAAYIAEACQDLGDSPALSVPAAGALALDHFQVEEKKWADLITSYLRAKGFGKLNLSEVPVPIAQLLAESFNNSQVSSDYLSLTWKEYEADPEIIESVVINDLAPSSHDLVESSKKSKKKKPRKKKTKGKEVLEPEDNNPTEQPASLIRAEESEEVIEAAPQTQPAYNSVIQLQEPSATHPNEGRSKVLGLDKEADNHATITEPSTDTRSITISKNTDVVDIQERGGEDLTADSEHASIQDSEKEVQIEQHLELFNTRPDPGKKIYTATDITNTVQDEPIEGVRVGSDCVSESSGQYSLSGPGYTYIVPTNDQTTQQQSTRTTSLVEEEKNSELQSPCSALPQTQYLLPPADQYLAWSTTLFPGKHSSSSHSTIQQTLPSERISPKQASSFSITPAQSVAVKPKLLVDSLQPNIPITSTSSFLPHNIANSAAIEATRIINTASLSEFPALHSIASSSPSILQSQSSETTTAHPTDRAEAFSSNSASSDTPSINMSGRLSKKQQRRASKAKRISENTSETKSQKSDGNQEESIIEQDEVQSSATDGAIQNLLIQQSMLSEDDENETQIVDTNEVKKGKQRLDDQTLIENAKDLASQLATRSPSDAVETTRDEDATRTMRSNSFEQIRFGLQRRFEDPITSPKTRLRTDFIPGVHVPWGFTNSSDLSASDIADLLPSTTTADPKTPPQLKPLRIPVAVPKIDFVKSLWKTSQRSFTSPKAESSQSTSHTSENVDEVKNSFQAHAAEVQTQASEDDSDRDSDNTIKPQRIETQNPGNTIKQESHQKSPSTLRADAPSFIPMSQTSEPPSLDASAIPSPELEATFSVPMSVSTSNNTEYVTPTSILKNRNGLFRQHTMRREALNVTFALPEPTWSPEDTTMSYPSEQSLNDPNDKPWNRARSRSMSWISSPTIDYFDDESYKHRPHAHEQLSLEEKIDMEEYMVLMWPKFYDYDPPVNRPWIYHEIHETPEQIMAQFSHFENHYRATPWEVTWRPIISQLYNIPLDVSAVLMKTPSGKKIPVAQYDWDNNVWRIWPPSKYVGVDLRADPEHPDYLAEEKLKQVQGLEVWNYRVYRSSRLTHKCLKKDCHNMVRDDNPQSMICLGCGPLSRVRWCCILCMFEDISNHWKDCGSPVFWPPSYMYLDPELSFPSILNKWKPLIQDINGFKSMERHRIHLTSMFVEGGYGLYPRANMQYFDIRTNKGPVELPDRLNRLINCALLDHTLRPIISYMYLILRDYLDKGVREGYREYHNVLRSQIQKEWDFDWSRPDGLELLESIKACDCMWYGMNDSPKCTDGCRAGPGLGEEYRQQGLKSLVEKLEKDHWILRIWRTLHPNVPDWRKRLVGKGFAGVKPKKFKDFLPVRGVGWDGHISRGKRVGEWRNKLTLEAPPPPTKMRNKTLVQKKDTFLWTEPEA